MTNRTTEEILKDADHVAQFYTERASMAIIGETKALLRIREKQTGELIAELAAKLEERAHTIHDSIGYYQAKKHTPKS